MKIIAHRGGKRYNPENSLKAIKKAFSYTTNVEIDVRKCGSGELVLHHDYLNTTDGKNYSIGNCDFSTLKKLNIKNSDSRIHKLEEVLPEVPENGTLEVELKETGIHKEVEELMNRHNVNRNYSSFLIEPLEKLKNSHTALLFLTGWEKNLKIAENLDCNAIHPSHYILDKKRVEEAKEKGFKINTWTVNDRKKAKVLEDWGVDGVISDSLTGEEFS